MERTSTRNGRTRPVKEPKSDDGKGRTNLPDLVTGLVAQFVQLNGQAAERISGVRRVDDGWSVLVDVVDVERIPATTSVLSTYRVDADAAGQLTGFERIRRFTRAATDGR
jgi:hypothetical protein